MVSQSSIPEAQMPVETGAGFIGSGDRYIRMVAERDAAFRIIINELEEHGW